MTARDDVDRLLVTWFDADAPHREPEHLLETVLARTARTRRRPGWVIPERWIPMSTITSAIAAAPRLSWRLIGLAALLLLALVAGVALLVGTQPRTLPAPYGPASNGLIAFSAAGDIYTVDPVSGNTRALIDGPETDLGPIWSRDGTHIAFRRQGPGGESLYVAREDGRDLALVMSETTGSIESISFSPDGREVMFSAGTPSKISIAKVDGSGMRTLDLPMPADEPTFRPPNGAQVAFIGFPTTDSEVGGVYLVNADGTDLRTLVEPSRRNTAYYPSWSPDGSLLAYGAADFTVQDWTVQAHVMAADGSGDHTLPAPAGVVWTDRAAWSNDGTRLAMLRGYSTNDDSGVVGVVIPVNGSVTAPETGQFAGSPSFAWAPDDSSVLMLPAEASDKFRELLILDPLTGSTRHATWAPDLTASWQRLAP